MTVADFMVYAGGFAALSGLFAMFLEIILTVWDIGHPEWLAKGAITMILAGTAVFMIGGLCGGCPACFDRHGRYY